MDTNEKVTYTCLDCIKALEAEGERLFGQRSSYQIVPSVEEIRHRENLRKLSYFSLAILKIFRLEPAKPKFGFRELGITIALTVAVSVLLACCLAPHAAAQKGSFLTSGFTGEFLIFGLILCPASASARYLYYRMRQLPEYQARYKEWEQYHTCHLCGKLHYKDG